MQKNKKNILVVSNPEKMDKELFQWIGGINAYDMNFAETDEKAIELCHQQLFDMVLVDTTDKEIHAAKLRAILPILNSEVLLVPYKGETGEKIDNKVKHAFEMRKMKRMKKLLILDSSMNNHLPFVPPFSLN